MSYQRKRWLSFLGGGASLALLGLTLSAGSSFPQTAAQHAKAAPSAKAAPKEEVSFPHMDKALAYLRAAQRQLQQSEPWFSGHREKAISQVDAAVTDVQAGITEYMGKHPTSIRNEINPDTISVPAGHHFPAALKLVQQAEGELNSAQKLYSGKRDEALAQTKTAIAEMEQGMAYYRAHPEK